MKKFKALIVGSGSIGALKPDEFDSPESKQIYTHAHACYSHPRIELTSIVDNDYEKAEKAAKKWNCHCANKVQLEMLKDRPDIVIVATNTDTHYDIIHQLIPYRPAVIICEKPFCSNLDQAQNISQLCVESGIKLLVNYTREFVPELKQLSNDLKNGVYGDIYNFTLRYSRGLMREACHAFYWCLQSFGEINRDYNYKEDYAIYDSPVKNDYSHLRTFKTKELVNLAFIPIGKAYSTYNADIYTEKGRIELLNNWKTIRFHELVKSSYGDYSATNLLFEDKQTQLDQALTFLLDHAIDIIHGTASDNWREALEVHKHLKLQV